MMGFHGFDKHSIVFAKLTNTVSSYSQEGPIYALQVCNNACMCLKLGGIQITLCVIRSMSAVELPMHFESAHSVPKLLKF